MRVHLESTVLVSQQVTESKTFRKNITLGKFLAQGSQFEVREGTKNVDGVPVAVAIKKLIPPTKAWDEAQRFSNEYNFLRLMTRDITVMKQMKRCPYTLNLVEHGSFIDPARERIFYQVVELATQGNLADFLDIGYPSKDTSLLRHMTLQFEIQSYTVRKSILSDIARGLHALHQQNIIHMNLKLNNILVFKSEATGFHAKLCDFSSAVLLNHLDVDDQPIGERNLQGTAGYLASEYMEVVGRPQEEQSQIDLRRLDIFSFAVIALEVLSSCRVEGELWGNLDVALEDRLRHLSHASEVLKGGETIIELMRRCICPAQLRCYDTSELLIVFNQETNLNPMDTETGPPLAYTPLYLNVIKAVRQHFELENYNPDDELESFMEVSTF